MEIKQLEYVIMAADLGSFNKASEFLYTTQSNVSKVIGRLEKELGYAIFLRQGKGVALTDAGKMLYEQSQEILGMLKKIQDSSGLTHKICFHIASTVSNFIARRFAEFVEEHNSDNFCLKMWEGSLTRCLSLVEKGEAELAFLYLGERQRDSFQTFLQRKGLAFEPLLPAQVEVCLGRKNPMYDRDSIADTDLKNLKYVSLLEDNISKNYHLRQLVQSLHMEEAMEGAVKVSSNCALMNLLEVTDRTYLCYGTVLDTVDGRPDAVGIRTIPVTFSGRKEAITLGYIHRKEEAVSMLGEKFLHLVRAGYAEPD